MSTPPQDPYDENYEPEANAAAPTDAFADVLELPAEPHVDPYAEADNAPAVPSNGSWGNEPAASGSDLWAPAEKEKEEFAATPYEPVSPDEGNRRSGLAYSAGIAFFASTAFMLFLGWLADLVLGSSPWGLVLGIVIGAAIGFIQFFRITSQIFSNEKKSGSIKPLLTGHDDDNVDQ